MRRLSQRRDVHSGEHMRMTVKKRSGVTEPLSFDKISMRISKLCYNLSVEVDAIEITRAVIAGLYDGITTSEIDHEAARVAAELSNRHPHHAVLGARLIVSDLHRQTEKRYSALVVKMRDYVHPRTGKHQPLVTEELADFVLRNQEVIDGAVVHNRDNNFSYFGLKTLMRSYLLKMNNRIAESPQHMYMRVACALRMPDVDGVVRLYGRLSRGEISHASPTMFNAGVPQGQLASCFLLQVAGVPRSDGANGYDQDSIKAIYKTLSNCADISKSAGGIGLSISTIRAKGSYIAGTNGTSNGIIPMLRCFNATAKYVDQGGNKRPGAIAVYLEPWHADVFSFLDLRKPGGVEERRCRDLFTALWVPDLLMRRVKSNGDWTLMCPSECPGLTQVHGQAFDDLYTQYEREGRGSETIKAIKLWNAIVTAQEVSGSPYMLYKDEINRANMQCNEGVVTSSNLCVAGNTYILTKEGPRNISSIANSHLVPKELEERAAELKRAEEQLEHATQALKKLLKKKGALDANQEAAKERWTAERVAMKARIEAYGNVDRDPKPKSQATCEVWNGKAWSAVTPVQTSESAPLFRVTTSHGSVIDCTEEHQWILEDGVARVPTVKLALGARLRASPPVVYEGADTHVMRSKKAFRRGFVFSYALKKTVWGPQNLGPNPPSLKVTGMIVPKADVTEETVEKLGYDAKSMLAQMPSADHETLAYLPLPEAEQSLQDRLNGPLETRKAWVQGFLASAGARLLDTKGHYELLKRARMMLRSVGEDARIKRVSRGNLWQLHWPSKDDDGIPTVVGVEQLGASEPTYCFTESEEHAGVFEEQLTGQCTEIVEVTGPSSISTCNLCSVVLNKFVQLPTDDDEPDAEATFLFDKLHEAVKESVVSMNNVIDRTHSPTEDVLATNLKMRPIGIGVQGLADAFLLMRYPWETSDPERLGKTRPHPEAMRLNVDIFETMYHAALEASVELAEAHGPYPGYAGSPYEQGKLHFDLCGVAPSSGRWDWDTIRAKIAKHGVRNSLLIAPMPTASTAQILGNNECFEPFTSNIYTRNVLAGNFQVVNKHLIYDFSDLGLWCDELKNEIILNEGSVQTLSAEHARQYPLIAQIPDDIKELYKTVWEISMRTQIDFAAARKPFIDQSQSFNWHVPKPTAAKLTGMHFYAWEKKLKTGMYYLRTQGVAPDKVIDTEPLASDDVDAAAALACSVQNPEDCVMCGS